MWWALHYGGRGGAQALAISAVDIALWDLRARRQEAALWRLLGGFDPRVPCYAGGIDLDFTLDALLRQTDDNLARGFRAIKMKVGRASLHEDVERVRAMRAHLGQGFPLMADANMSAGSPRSPGGGWRARKVKAKGEGPCSRRWASRSSASSTVGTVPAGTHQST